MLVRAGLIVAAAAVLCGAPSQAQQTDAELKACINSADISVRDPCVRAGLISKNADVRSAALAAAFRYRKNLVINFEVPESVRNWQKRVDQGESWNKASTEIQRMHNFVLETGQVVNFVVSSFDAQANTFVVTPMDLKFDRSKPNAGTGYVSGDTVQISSAINVMTTTSPSNCAIELTLVDGAEMRGFFGCSGLNAAAFPRTPARMRIM